MIRIDGEKLREIVKRRGFSNFKAVAEKAASMDEDLALSTIYSIAGNGNWTRDRLQALCRVLECDPRDFIYFEREAPKAVAPIQLNGTTVKELA